MITIKSDKEIAIMKTAGSIVRECFEQIEEMMKPGVTTLEINDVVHKFILSKGSTPSFLNYGGFPYSICASVNDEIVHGFPNKKPLKDGDIVSIDIGACYKGYHGDAARTYAVGSISQEAQRLIDVTKQCFFEGLKFVREGYRISDISIAIQNYAETNGFSVVRDLVGHGIGSKLHEDPSVPNFYDTRGVSLKKGMTIAIEPMINEGSYQTIVSPNKWTYSTKDGKLSAHYENTVLITDGEPILLTN